MHHILLETDWWALPNASSIVWIRSAVHEILADKAFMATDGLISQSFVVAFVHPTYVQIALIWGFPVQLSLWKLVHWLWRYKLNEVCDIIFIFFLTKWYYISIYFAFLYPWYIFVISIILLLLINNITGFFWESDALSKKDDNNIV